MTSERIQGQKSHQPQQPDTEGLIADATAHPFVVAVQLYPGKNFFFFLILLASLEGGVRMRQANAQYA